MSIPYGISFRMTKYLMVPPKANKTVYTIHQCVWQGPVSAYTYIYIYIYIEYIDNICVYIYTYFLLIPCVYIHMYTCIYVYTQRLTPYHISHYVHTITCTYIYIYIYIYIYVEIDPPSDTLMCYIYIYMYIPQTSFSYRGSHGVV